MKLKVNRPYEKIHFHECLTILVKIKKKKKLKKLEILILK